MNPLEVALLVAVIVAFSVVIWALTQRDLSQHYEQLWRVERKRRQESDQILEKAVNRGVRLQIESEGQHQRLRRKNDALRRKMLRQRWYIGKLEGKS